MKHLKITFMTDDGQELYNATHGVQGTQEEQSENIISAFEDFLSVQMGIDMSENALQITDCVSL